MDRGDKLAPAKSIKADEPVPNLHFNNPPPISNVLLVNAVKLYIDIILTDNAVAPDKLLIVL